MPTKDLTLITRASWALAGLVAITSVTGIVFGGRGLYDAYPASLAGLVGQDIASLVVGLPVLLWAMHRARRGSVVGVLAWAGTLFYLAYSYAFFVLGGFNALFLLYVAVVGLSLYSLLGLLLALDVPAIASRFDPSTPRHVVAGFLVGTASLFVLMWGGMSLAMGVAGEQPDPVVHLVVALDGAVLLPALLLAGAQLWRGTAWGYALGGIVLAKTALTGLTLAFTTGLGAVWAGSIVPFDAFLLVLFGLMGVVTLGLGRLYAGHITETRTGITTVAAIPVT